MPNYFIKADSCIAVINKELLKVLKLYNVTPNTAVFQIPLFFSVPRPEILEGMSVSPKNNLALC